MNASPEGLSASYVRRLLEQEHGSITRVGQRLGLGHHAMTDRLKQLGLHQLARELRVRHSPSAALRALGRRDPKQARARLLEMLTHFRGEFRALARELGVSGSGVGLMVREFGLLAAATELRAAHRIRGNRKWLPQSGYDRARLEGALRHARGNKSEAARLLGMPTSSFLLQCRVVGLRTPAR